MFKNKAPDGKNNICGRKMKTLREALDEKPSQREFSELLQVAGVDLDKNAVQRIESGDRFVTDIELLAIVRVLGTTYSELLNWD